jgi:hypothetical protein
MAKSLLGGSFGISGGGEYHIDDARVWIKLTLNTGHAVRLPRKFRLRFRMSISIGIVPSR